MLRLIRAREIRLMWDGDKVCALAGPDLQEGVGGFGMTFQQLSPISSNAFAPRTLPSGSPTQPNNFATMAC